MYIISSVFYVLDIDNVSILSNRLLIDNFDNHATLNRV